ncbi:DUF4249 family protein [Mucilaginibacter paludis]|uniref:DUF4249 domain-containing protein n=1 Tax=Mucilaginibacter paludis DSM 18603 TaxID=714943 RepID=H1Y7Z7_9SPHI|nr:DUF4249 family protein [Mucilaginibacter paludis]EHQ30483.1 hypothetical protein Mucpa_6430 [Mucilaginibacter paludis DSM 18603]
MEITIKKISFLLFIVAACVISSCKKESTGTAIEDQPVVVGYLIPGQPISVKIYQQKGLADTANYGSPITGLKLNISDGSKTIQLTETATGTYTYSDLSFLTTGKTYTLQFNYQNTSVTAQTLMPAKPENYTASTTLINLPLATNITPGVSSGVALTLKWSNPDSLYHVLVFKNDDASPFNIHPNRNSQVNFTFNAKQAAYYDVHFDSFNYLGIYRIILYSVNKEYIDILTSNANSSSQKLTNPPTNVTNGFGIFTAMQADTITLTLTQY